MLEQHGRQILEILGRDAGEPGILLPDQLSNATERLEQAVQQEQLQRQQAIEQALAEGRPAPRFEAIGLKQRVQPFLKMLQRCQKAQQPLTWGV